MGEIVGIVVAIGSRHRFDPVSMAIILTAALLAVPICLYMHEVEMRMRARRKAALRRTMQAPKRTPRGACPRCADARALREDAGALHEAVCEACGGRFLPAPAVERVLEERGVSAALLRDLARGVRGARLCCPGCGTQMTALPLKGVPVDLCRGCGGLWLDAGELSELSGGLHPEVGAASPLPTPRPAAAGPPDKPTLQDPGLAPWAPLFLALNDGEARRQAEDGRKLVRALGAVLAIFVGAAVLEGLHRLGLF